MCAADNLHL